jgi:hypothetical protein
MNVGWEVPIDRNNSIHTPWGQFFLHWGVELTGSPCNIFKVCNEVYRHLSDHGTRPTGNHLPVKAHSAKLNEEKESEISQLTCTTYAKIAQVILKRQESREITILCLQRKFLFDS